MKIFLAGVGGVFMAGIAQLARARGDEVFGCDDGVYPPMSDLLRAHNIEVLEGYSPDHLDDDIDTVIIGNALSRGNPLVEHLLNEKTNFTSGPAWLRENVLRRRAVIAVAGTHGKTTTASILAWILQSAGRAPGFLIGGKPGNFDCSAALGDGEHFVVEADEYDTAFFDKRAKFVHYFPDIAVLNNLEFDHADIYDDVRQIQKQFHHLVRLVPSDGTLVVNADDARLAAVLDMGCWSKLVRFSTADPVSEHGASADAEWRATKVSDDCSEFNVLHHGAVAARVEWQCIGAHNMQNALAAVAAASVAGVPPADAGEHLRRYQPAARRLQLLFESAAVTLYDDFAHHPTAIRATLDAVRAKHPDRRLIAVVELRSNTMRSGGHGAALSEALSRADCAMVSGGDAGDAVRADHADEIISALKTKLSGNDMIVTMSNGGFGGVPKKIAAFLATL